LLIQNDLQNVHEKRKRMIETALSMAQDWWSFERRYRFQIASVPYIGHSLYMA
jgi:hypothetical protein